MVKGVKYRHFADMRDEFIEKLTEAIKTRPYSGREKAMADMLLREFDDMGAWSMRDGAGNVVAVLRGDEPGPVIMLNGHMDIVPEGNTDAWGGHDPFDPDIEDGKLYGRGSCDMLQGDICNLMAFREIKRYVDRGGSFRGTLVFTAVVNEEPAESQGVLYLMNRTMPELGIEPDVVYLSESTEGHVYVGQRGKVELVVDVYGKVAHSSAPWQGISAVEKAMPVIEAVMNNFYKKPVTHPQLGTAAMCVTDIEVTPGRMYSCVPDHCSITIDRRYVPPVTIPDTIEEVREFLDHLSSKDPDFKAEVHQRVNRRKCYTGLEEDCKKQHPTWIDDPGDPHVEKCFEALRSVGQDPEKRYFDAGTDGSVTRGACGITTMIYSFGQRMGHKPQEHCIIDNEIRGLEGLTAILCKELDIDLADICGKE